MTHEKYFATYARFETKSKKDAAVLLGADCIVGDKFSIEFRADNGKTTAWVVNKFGADAGFLDANVSHKLNILSVKGFLLCAVLSFVAYSENPDPGHYWGEFAVFAFEKTNEAAFKKFVASCAKTISDGIRPKINLEAGAVEQIINSGGKWKPKQRVPFPKLGKHSAMIKKSCSFLDSMVKKGRQKNVGCYIVSWAFLLFMVALIIFGLKSCGVF